MQGNALCSSNLGVSIMKLIIRGVGRHSSKGVEAEQVG